MRLDRQPDGTLVVRANPALLRTGLVCLGAVVVGAVVHAHPLNDSRVWLGVLGSLVPFTGAALLERVRFEFDVAQRRLRWRRANWFRGLRGELAFDEIREVALRVRRERDSERPRAPETPWYRVVLVTRDGDLRLSDRMYADLPRQTALADAIRMALGLAPGAAPAEESIEQLAAGGEKIAAIKLVRRQLGLGLAEAKQHVEKLGR